MSFKNGKPFSRKYKSARHLAIALKRNQKNKNRSFSPEGQKAAELLELIAVGASIALVTTATGAEIGTFFGPLGTGIGAGIGLALGLAASYLVIKWYVQVLPPNPDGSVVAVYRTV